VRPLGEILLAHGVTFLAESLEVSRLIQFELLHRFRA